MDEIRQKMLNWPDCYYREREPEKRLAMLDEADRLHLTEEDNIFRRKLFAVRYPDAADGKKKLDNFIKLWIEMRYLYENRGGFFRKNPNPKRLRKVLDQIGYFDLQNQSERNLMAQELQHLGMLYIALCQEDKQYGSLILGFSKMSDERLVAKIAGEFRTVAVYVPELYQMQEECKLLKNALTDAWCGMFPDHADLLQED